LTSINDEPSKKCQKIGMAFTVIGFANSVGRPVGGESLRIPKQEEQRSD
jgi:hypothetical protein